MPPSVTVITPTWNAARYAREAAASVAAQSPGGIEHLVLDAGSTDGTTEAIRAGNPNATIIAEGIRDGLYAAVNRGIARARGEVIAWLNADDFWKPGTVAAALSALEGARDASLAFGDLEVLDDAGSVRRVSHPSDVLARCAAGELVDGFVTPLCCFWRRDALLSLGPYDPSLPVVADRDLWMRLASRRPLPSAVKFDAVAGTFREHEGSISSGARGTHRSIEDHVRLWTRWESAPEATAAMRAAAHRLRQVALLDLATRDAKRLRLGRALTGLSALLRSGEGWWRPFAAIPANRRRRSMARSLEKS